MHDAAIFQTWLLGSSDRQWGPLLSLVGFCVENQAELDLSHLEVLPIFYMRSVERSLPLRDEY